MKRILRLVAAISSLLLFPAAALAVGGADCQNAGGSCGDEKQCATVPGMSTIGQFDCGELGSTYVCCKQGTTPPPVSGGGSTPTPAPAAAPASKPGYENFRLQLPGCVSTGVCKLDDIVLTGVAFANLLMSLSGALFFAAFIYGGAMYLMSFGRSDWVGKGTKAMTGAVIGMTIVLSAWTIVNYIASSITGKL